MTRVLFIIPKLKSMYGDTLSRPPYPHVGIAYLLAVLKRGKIPATVFDEGLGSKETLREKIAGFRPSVIAITGFSYAYAFLEKAIKRAKVLSPEIPVIVGGPHVAATGTTILTETQADFALSGEGEVSFPVFLRELEKKNPDFSRIDGLIWRKGEEIIKNPPAAFIPDLDALPFPDYEAFDLEKYPCFQERLLPILTSRGCPYGCNYCSVRLSMGRLFRPRSPKNVVDEIGHWYKKGFCLFDFNDDCFTLDLDRAEKICDLILEKKLKIKFQLYNGIRVDRVSLSLLKKLKKTGCIFIAYGCESGSEETLKRINKAITLSQVRQAVSWTNKAGIKNAVNFIVGHKEETYEEAKQTIRFAESLPTNFVNFYNLVPYPGTEVYEWAEKKARFLFPKETFLRQISYRDNVPIFETDEFTKAQREEIMRQGFSLYEKKALRFRLGVILGPAVFYLTRIDFLAKLARRFVFDNKYGIKIFRFLSKGSRR